MPWRQKESPFVFHKNTPPVFLVHATNDGISGGAPIELPRAIKADLVQVQVPVEITLSSGGREILVPIRLQLKIRIL
jgi:hypothetical protein